MDSAERMNTIDSAAPAGDWAVVGGDLRAAAVETAGALGGREFAREVELLASSDGPLPDAAAFARLEEAFPGAAERALDRSLEIASARRVEELERAARASARAGFRRGLREAFRPF